MSEKISPAMESEAMKRMLEEEDFGCLALSDGGNPYAVPVSYALLDGRIVIHGAMKGRKLDVVRDNPNACFVVSRNLDRARPHTAEGECTFRFESVICFGQARIVEEIGERTELLKKFKAWFDRRLNLDPAKNPITSKAAEHCSCIVIEIESMTGRRKG